MKRLLFLVIGALWLVLPTALFAGGQKEAGSTSSQSNPGELRLYWNPDHYYGIYKSTIADYAKEKGLKVNVQIFNWNEFHTKVSADFAARTPPDLIEVPSPWIPEFAASGNLVDLTSRIKAWPEHSDWFDSTWVETSYKDKLYGMKLHHTAFGLFYNVDEFKQAGLDPSNPPQTLSQFASDIHTLTTKLGGDKKGFGFDPTGQYLIPFLSSTQTPFLIKDNKSALDTQAVRSTLADLQKLARSGDVFIPSPGGEAARSDVRLLFYTGKVSMMISGPWELGNLKNKYPDLHYSVAMIPHVTGVDGLTLTAGTGLAIPKAASQPTDLVWGLMKKLTAVDVEVKATQEAGMLMPRKTWLSDPRIQDNDAVKLFGPLLAKATPFDIGARKANLPEITWGGPVFNKLYQTMIYSDKDMNKALDEYVTETNKLLSAQGN